MSDDLIRRSDAIKAIMETHCYCSENKVLTEIRNLPTIEPKRGKWEEKETFSIADDDPIIEQWQSARCSVCHKYHTTPYIYYFNEYNFCPNCGADMREREGE